MAVSNLHKVCKKGCYIAIISTMVETKDPESEIKCALDLIGPYKEKFTTVINPFTKSIIKSIIFQKKKNRNHYNNIKYKYSIKKIFV